MRDKLIELLETELACTKDGHGDCDMCEYTCADKSCIRQISEDTADFMLSKGVVVLPIKPNDTVYTISRGKIKAWEVYYVGINALGYVAFNVTDVDMNTRCMVEEDIGETVFLTEEDAINELKERKRNDRP